MSEADGCLPPSIRLLFCLLTTILFPVLAFLLQLVPVYLIFKHNLSKQMFRMAS